jgi:uncharacterized protein
MFTLQQFFGQDAKFYDLLEASAQEARQSVEALNRVMSKPTQIPSLAEFHQAKEADKKITQQISEALLNTFVTQLDREDIEALSEPLYKIPKTVEKIAERFIVSAAVVKDVNFGPHIALLEIATAQVVEMVQQLRRHPTLETIKRMNAALQKVEGDADKLILTILQDLYSGKHDPTKVMALKDLYELLEKVIDRCRDAGNVVTHQVLKHA